MAGRVVTRRHCGKVWTADSAGSCGRTLIIHMCVCGPAMAKGWESWLRHCNGQGSVGMVFEVVGVMRL